MNQIQSLLNDCLIRTKHVEHAAIIKLKDNSVWESTVGFNLQPQNALILSSAFFKNLLQVRREGLYFQEKQYKCVRADAYSIYLKNENRGLIAVKTDSYILVATYSEGMYPSVCVEAIEKLGRTISEIKKTESSNNLNLIKLMKTGLLENHGWKFVLKHIQASNTISIILQYSKSIVKALKEKDNPQHVNPTSAA
ncbi:unnamed protein product [Lepidochelys olivacea]